VPLTKRARLLSYVFFKFQRMPMPAQPFT
jgi:hypothetical protein